MVEGSLCISTLKPDLIYAISLEYSQKSLQCQISVVMSTFVVCWPELAKFQRVICLSPKFVPESTVRKCNETVRCVLQRKAI